MRNFLQPDLIRIYVLFSTVVLALFLSGCSGYQTVSYYGDGIYDNEVLQQLRQVVAPVNNNNQQNNGSFYKNYFADKASQGIQDDYIFTNVEKYQDTTPQQSSAGNYQAHGSWGDQVDRININVIYNRPFGWNMGWGWYNAPYTFGRSSFWGYNYHPWYFTYNYHPFYNPFQWGNIYPFNRPGWNNWGYNNSYQMIGMNQRYNTSRYSRLNGSREFFRTNRSNSVGGSAESPENISNKNQRRTNASGSTTTRRVSNGNTNSSQNSRTTRRYSNDRSTTNNSSYRSSSSSSTTSYRNSAPSSSTRSTSSSSSRSSSSSSRRR